jgi:hypothetical protein
MKYLSLDYRDFDKYDCDPDIPLTADDKKLISSEIKHLKDAGWNVISVDLFYGCCVVEDRIDIDYVPYIKIEPDGQVCSREGHPCEYCNDNCDEWATCPQEKKDCGYYNRLEMMKE